MRVDVRVEGLRELEQQLLRLEATAGKKALRQALRSSAGKVLSTAKQNAPGSIKRAIFASRRVRGITYIASDTAAQLTIGVHSKGPKAAPHAHLIEYGTKQRRTKEPAQTLGNIARGRTTRKRVVRMGARYYSIGVERGRVRPRSFMRKSWRQEGKVKLVNRFKRSLARKIDRLTQ